MTPPSDQQATSAASTAANPAAATWHRRLVRILLDATAALAALAMLLAVALAVRMATAPMKLDDLTPLLIRALSDDRRGLTTTADGTQLSWDNKSRTILVELDSVVTRNSAGEVVATLPRVNAELRALPLLVGRVRFNLLHAEGANVNLERNADGQLVFLGTKALAKVKTDADLPLSAIFAGWPDRVAAAQDMVGRMGEVVVRSTRLTIVDKAEGMAIEAFMPDLRVETNEAGAVIGSSSIKVTTAEKPVDLTLSLRLFPDNGTGETIVTFRDLNLAAIGRLDTDLAGLTHIDMAMSGSINVTYMPEGTMQLTIDAAGDKGAVALAELPQPLAIEKFKANISAVATGSAGVNAATINTFGFETAGIPISVTGRMGVRDNSNERVVRFEAGLANIPLNKVIELWPAGLAEGGRTWVTQNMADGTLQHAKAMVRLRIGWPDFDAITVDKVEGDLALSNATVHFFRPVPPARGVNATGTFDADGIYIKAAGGKLLNLALGESKIDIKGLNNDVQTMDVSVPATGSLVDIMTAVNSEPLKYADKVGLKPSDLQGTADVVLNFKALPLLNDLKVEDVDMEATGAIRNFANATLLPAFPLTGGNLAVQLTTSQLGIKGDMLAKGVKVNVDWGEIFDPARGQPASHAKINAGLVADDFKRLDIELPGALAGAAPANIDYRRFTDRADTLSAVIDLTPVALDMSRLTYKKKAGVKAQLSIDGKIDDKGINLTSIKADGPGLKLLGSGMLQPDGTLENIKLGPVEMGENTLTVDVTRARPGMLRYQVRGKQMNVGAWLDASNDSQQQVSQSPFEVDLQVQRAIFGIDDTTKNNASALKFFTPFSMAATYTGKGWEKIVIDGMAGGTERFVLNLMPDAKGAQTLMARSDNFGAVLDALNWTDDIKGGRLAIDGTSTGQDQPLVATVTINDYVVRDLPFMARLVNVLSLDGMAHLLQGDSGLKFEKLKGTIIIEGDVLRFKQLRTSGGSLGLTAAGTIDTASKNIDLEGTVIPFSGVNSIIGSIPIVGNLLTGGGGGVFAATYYAKGKLNDPQFSTNPLATLAPGFVRNMFFLDDH